MEAFNSFTTDATCFYSQADAICISIQKPIRSYYSEALWGDSFSVSYLVARTQAASSKSQQSKREIPTHSYFKFVRIIQNYVRNKITYVLKESFYEINVTGNLEWHLNTEEIFQYCCALQRGPKKCIHNFIQLI
jgi:hypothetical protein